jgi:biotin carboxyl carrier protein
MKYETQINDKTWPVILDPENHTAEVNGEQLEYSLTPAGKDRWLLQTGFLTNILSNVTRNGSEVEFTMNGLWVKVNVKDEKDLLLDKLGFKVGVSGGEGKINAPMPGKILKILKQKGDEVKLGDPVIILEAMKMENELKSPVDGTLVNIHISEGESVEKNTLLLEIETIG